MASDEIVIWQLSDLHLLPLPPRPPLRKSRSQVLEQVQDQFHFEETDLPTPYRSFLSNATNLVTERRELSPSYLVVCGDLAHMGNEVPADQKKARGEKADVISAKLQLARYFLTQLADRVNAKKVLVVPGNHDRKRGEEDTETAFGAFNNTFGGGKSGLFFTPDNNGLPNVDPTGGQDGVVFCLFNTATRGGQVTASFTTLSRALGKKGRARAVREALSDIQYRDPGWVPATHMDEAGNRLVGKAGSVRVAVTHHSPGSTGLWELRQFSYICNSGEFVRWLLKNRISLLLHGHKHELCQMLYSISPEAKTGDSQDMVGLRSCHVCAYQEECRKMEPSLQAMPPLCIEDPQSLNRLYAVGTLSAAQMFGFNIIRLRRDFTDPPVRVHTLVNLEQGMAGTEPLFCLPSPEFAALVDRYPSESAKGSVKSMFGALYGISQSTYEFAEQLQDGGFVSEILRQVSRLLQELRNVVPHVVDRSLFYTYATLIVPTLREALANHGKSGRDLGASFELRMTTYREIQDAGSEEDKALFFDLVEREKGHLHVKDLLIVTGADENRGGELEFVRSKRAERSCPAFELRVLQWPSGPRIDFHIIGGLKVVCVNNVDSVLEDKDKGRLHVLELGSEAAVWLSGHFDRFWDKACSVDEWLEPEGVQP